MLATFCLRRPSDPTYVQCDYVCLQIRNVVWSPPPLREVNRPGIIVKKFSRDFRKPDFLARCQQVAVLSSRSNRSLLDHIASKFLQATARPAFTPELPTKASPLRDTTQPHDFRQRPGTTANSRPRQGGIRTRDRRGPLQVNAGDEGWQKAPGELELQPN